MKNIEKLAIWLIPVALIGALGSTFSNMLFNNLVSSTQSGSESILPIFGLTMGQAMALLTGISPAFKFLAHVVIAIWLYVITKRDGNRYFVWGGFGLFFGLLVPAIYYLVKIYEVQSIENEKN